MIASVALPIPIDRTFSYSIPARLEDDLAPGKRVRVTFNGRERWGIVVALSEGDGEGLEPILAVRPSPSFSEEVLAFSAEVSERYLAPLGILVNRILPHSVRSHPERTLTIASDLGEITSHIERYSRRAPKQAAVLRALISSPAPQAERDLRESLGPVRKPIDRLIELGLVTDLSDRTVLPSLDRPEGIPKTGRAILFGEERSGAYARLIASTVGEGRTVLILAPEILAAAGLRRSLAAHLGIEIDLYHGRLSDGERGRIWERARTGKTQLVLGTRSALFLPLHRPGLIIVDEEQDRSYKQSDAIPYYHGREIAAWRGRYGLVALGSAAPSVETYHEAVARRIDLIEIKGEPASRTWRMIDHRTEEGISPPLAEEIRATLESGRRVLIGTGRPGYYPIVVCRSCRRPLRCRSCGTNLTYSPISPRLVCPTCGATSSPHCDHCGDTRVEFLGSGSVRIEVEIRDLFPRARVIRVDAASLKRGDRPDMEAADIVIGTPMIAKGPRMDGIGLVASLDIDRLLAAPDFRANERAYQYLIGLAGRMAEGRVVVQTGRPDHSILRFASAGDHAGFYARELEERRKFFYPPFSRLARITLIETDPGRRRAAVIGIEKVCAGASIEVLGPVPHPRRPGGVNLVLKAKGLDPLRSVCLEIAKLGLRVQIDIDPDRL